MAFKIVTDDTIAEIANSIEKMNEQEKKFLLTQINTFNLLKNGFPEITKNPADVPMTVIDKWKHDSRRNA